MKQFTLFVCSFAGLLVANPWPAPAQTGAAAIAKLNFMSGSWHCTGTLPDGRTYNASHHYSFPTSGPWMEEQTTSLVAGQQVREIQFWGYDGATNALVAYDFLPQRVMQKRVYGWTGHNFTAHNIAPPYDVALHGDARTMQWIVTYSNGSRIVETCKR